MARSKISDPSHAKTSSTPTNELVVDASAWIEYFRGSHIGAEVRGLLASARLVLTSAVTLAEVCSKFAREGLDPSQALVAISRLSKVVDVGAQDAFEAGVLHAQVRQKSPKFSLGDAFILQLARSRRGKVVTADRDFESMPEAIVLHRGGQKHTV